MVDRLQDPPRHRLREEAQGHVRRLLEPQARRVRVAMPRRVELPPPKALAGGKAVDPRDPVVRRPLEPLERLEMLVPVAAGEGQHADVPAGDPLHPKLHPRDRPQKPRPRHHRPEGRVLRREGPRLPVWGHHVERADVLPERPRFRVVLPVDVHRQRARQRRRHRPARHREPPAVLQGRAPHVLQRRPALGLDHALLGVPAQDAAHPGEVEDRALGEAERRRRRTAPLPAGRPSSPPPAPGRTPRGRRPRRWAGTGSRPRRRRSRSRPRGRGGRGSARILD